MKPRRAGRGLVCIGLVSACAPWQEEVVIQLRDPSLVSVAPPSGDPRDGAIPATRAPAVMKVADGSTANLDSGSAMSMWLVRGPDGSISSFASYYPQTLSGSGAVGRKKNLETVLLSSAGELHLSGSNAPLFRLADLHREPGGIALFPALVDYRELAKQETTSSESNGVKTFTTQSTFASIGDRVVFATPASNVKHGVRYSRPSRVAGAVWVITGLVLDGLALYILEKGRSAKDSGQISESTLPIVYGTAGVLASVSIPFHAYGGYLLFVPEERTPLP